jgi:hypothetical protein
MRQLHTAWQQATKRNGRLKGGSENIRQQLSGQSEAAASVKGLHQMADQQKKLSGLDERVEDTKRARRHL